MMKSFTKGTNAVLACMVVVLMGGAVVSWAKGSDYEKKMEELKKLQKKKDDIHKKMQSTKTISIDPQKLAEIVTRYEKLYADCRGRKSERCAGVMFDLGKFYYDEGRDKFVKDKETYENRMDEWERTGQGPEPINPVPDYSKALNIYRQLIAEYPSFPRNDEAYYQIGHILLLAGEIDSSQMAYQEVVKKFPNSRRASSAHFRLADFSFMEHHHSKALRHYENVKQPEVTIEVWEMVHYRKAELYYNIADFDRAVELFHTYVEQCDAGVYPKRQFRNMALEYMAITFSDMPEGADRAIKFFKKLGSRPYEDYVIYTVGFKNREHGQFDNAILALRTALKNYPYYKDAPIAQHKLVECLVVKKELEESNREREKLVDTYQPGTEWYTKNAREKAIIEQANGYVNKALSNVCLYYHAMAMKKKDRSLYEKAQKRYQEFFKKFPNDKWRLYEFKYNAAEVYNELGQYNKAVDLYWFVALEDLKDYPSFRVQIDSLLYDDPKEYEQAVKNAKKTGAMAVSQSDAGYNAIVALNKARKRKIASDGMSDAQAYSLPETQKLVDYVLVYRERFPQSQNTVELLYLVGNAHYEAKVFDKAIAVFEDIATSYPNSPLAEKSFRMLAKTYYQSGEFDMALKKYKELLARVKPNTNEYQEVVDLAAAAIYSKAEKMRKASNYMGAADVYKTISGEFPSSNVADKGWFEAAVCYEEATSHELAAGTFESFTKQFPKSKLVERAFVRAAENYKKAQKWELAAGVYAKAAATITKADFAIGALAEASECYQKVGNYDQAGKMFGLVFLRYADDSRTPQALYNAGLILEKGKLYERAIQAYGALAEKYPKSEYAEEASFSVGLCYENMKKPVEAAEAFADFAKKFDNRTKQVEALVRGGDAYYGLKKMKEAETAYLSATTIYDKFKRKGEFNIGGVARAYSRLGDIYAKDFVAIRLVGKNQKEVKAKLKEKTKALEKAGKQYGNAIGTEVSEYVLMGTYRIGDCFVDLANAEKEQQLFGKTEQKIAAKFQILSKLEKYYIKAQEKFYFNIDKAHQQNLTGEWVDKSIDAFMKMAHLKGMILEEAGDVLANAPIPRGLTPEEQRAYKEILEEKKLQTMDAALPKYEDAVKVAKELGIAESGWLDSSRARIEAINPGSEWLNVEIQPWTPQQAMDAPQGETQPVQESIADQHEAQSGKDVIKLEEEKEPEGEKKGRRGRKRRRR